MTFDWAGIVEQEGAALGDAAGMDHGAPVPATPGWDTTELLCHVGLVHARTSVILRTGTMERPSRARRFERPEPQVIGAPPAHFVEQPGIVPSPDHRRRTQGMLDLVVLGLGVGPVFWKVTFADACELEPPPVRPSSTR